MGRCLLSQVRSSATSLSRLGNTRSTFTRPHIRRPSPVCCVAHAQLTRHTSVSSPIYKQVHDVDCRVIAQTMPYPGISLRQQTHHLQSSSSYYHPSWLERPREYGVVGTVAGLRGGIGGATPQGKHRLSLGNFIPDCFLRSQLGEINDELDTLSNDANNQITQTMLRAIQRHRDVHQDNIREFRRTKVWCIAGPWTERLTT